MEYLYEKLEAYGKSDYYGFHMPGHKRNSDVTRANLPYGIDITEIEGFDNLHHAEEIIREAEVRAASMYHAEETHYLINGSTAGILSAVMGCTKKGGKILMARNCHKSVYHAVFLNELRPVYIYPEFDETMELNMAVSPEKIERLLEEHKEVQAVVLTSPTYDGVLSDIERISEIVHQKKIPLIVDEAHGAHFGFHPYFPENANTKGADVVIHSLHKTLPALTQTALIHLNGTRIDRRKIRNYLHIFQTSSPSYVLMASMDECLRTVAEQGDVLFETYVKNLESKRGELKKLKHIRLMETEEFDRSKLVLSVKDTILKKENRVFTGKMLSVAGLTKGLADTYGAEATGIQLQEDLLNQYHLQMEMAAGTYVIAMTSIGDTKEGMDRLLSALFEIDEELEKNSEKEKRYYLPRQEQVLTSFEVEGMRRMETVRSMSWQESAGFISMEYAYLYPPGIPLIVPGERITKETAAMLVDYQNKGFSVEGISVENYIEVLINE
mgnify:CR=1 FL=1